MSDDNVQERLNAVDKAFKLSVLLGPKHFDKAMTHIKAKNFDKGKDNFKTVCSSAGISEKEAVDLWNYLKEYKATAGGAGTGW